MFSVVDTGMMWFIVSARLLLCFGFLRVHVVVGVA